jgi:mono/diheme cytochrome c family protein
MSAQPQSSTSRSSGGFEPKATTARVPIWLFVAFFVLLYWGMVYFDRNSGWFAPQVYAPYRSMAELQTFQPPSGGADLARGKTVYENVCALCHNPDGAGKPGQAPLLAGSEWVTGSPARLIRIPLAGLAGPLTVKGEAWNLAMPAMGAALPDEDLAAVLTYMRQSWGNKASAITAEQVKGIRKELGNRSQPFSADELNAIP